MATSFKLYELSDAINNLNQMMEDGVEGLEDTIESVEGSFQDKAEGIIRLWRSKCAERDIIKSEIYRLQQRADKLDKDANWLHGYVEREMLKANMTEIKSPIFQIKLRMSPPRVDILNQALIPEEFTRTKLTIEADKTAIKEALKNGQSVPGAELKKDLKLNVR